MKRLLLLFSLTFVVVHLAAAETAKPNLLIIYVDDLGYGDVQCYNPERGKISTPHLDKLASQGMRFTDAHSTSAMCTPSRYSLLTGRYNWRTRLQEGVLGAYGNTLIDRGRQTLPTLLKQHGYATACIGKWHLGWQWPANAANSLRAEDRLTEGPTARGFDSYFGQETPSLPPYCFIENDHILGVLSAQMPAGSGGNRPGLMTPDWKSEDILPALTDRAVRYLRERAKVKSPFFLYLPLSSIHYPVAPSALWQGKSGMGAMADFIMETDAAIGRVVDTLGEIGLEQDTLVLVTSDNGRDPTVDWNRHIELGHFPSGPFRGRKFDAWEGGHRVPFIVRWPAVVQPGATCSQLVGQNDLLATCAQILGATLPATAGEDSVSIMPLLRGGSDPIRETLVHHSGAGRFAIREGKWKLLLCPDSGGSSPGSDPGSPPVQLYDLTADEGERNNLQAKHPDIVMRLTQTLEKQVADGRSTPGPKQKNDVPVDIFKKGQ